MEVDSSTHRLPAADASRLTDVVIHERGAAVAIAKERAVAAAATEYDAVALGATVDAYLESVTVAGSLRSDEPIDGLLVWIVSYSGMSHSQGAPDGSGPSRVLTTAYIFIDAITSEFLFADWVE